MKMDIQTITLFLTSKLTFNVYLKIVICDGIIEFGLASAKNQPQREKKTQKQWTNKCQI